MASVSTLLNTKQAATYLGISHYYLRNLRHEMHAHNGPDYIRNVNGRNNCFYQIKELDRWKTNHKWRKKMKTFKNYSDSGHGWLAVKRSLLAELGLLDKITRYSYQKGATVYLEEDADALTFVSAYETRYGSYQVNNIDHGNRSWVRNYDSYSPVAFVDVPLTDTNLVAIANEINQGVENA